MAAQLRITLGHYSNPGRKAVNQDFHGASVPQEPQLSAKGIAVAVADGISSSDVSHIASQAAINGFLADYYCTPETWSVKKSAQRVLAATNSWLHAQTKQSRYCYDMNRGYVCTLSALVIKSATAHIFHVGDTRIYRLQGRQLEQLTNDHRLWVGQDKSYLSRAMGMDFHLELDYVSLPVEKGDIFLLASDGVYEYASPAFIANAIADSDDLAQATQTIVDEAFVQGSPDNLTLQIVRIEDLPAQDAGELYRSLTELPFPPELQARMEFDGYRIIRRLHASSRSHLFLALDIQSNAQVALKTPSIDQRGDPAYLERFLLEEWIARRIDNPHVLKPCPPARKRNYLYTAAEYIEGQTLSQWMIDHPKPDIETVRQIVEQIGKGLRAFHRLEMLHQDLRPDNILIDRTGSVKIIDFGSARVAGIADMANPLQQPHILGTAQYSAPEYFLAENGTPRSDLFSLGVITYQMLTGQLPYGAEVAKCKTRSAQNKLAYIPAQQTNRAVPAWVDLALKKAVQTTPYKRYADLTEFLFDLRHPNPAYLNQTKPPLLERDPVAFWKGLSFILAIAIGFLLAR